MVISLQFRRDFVNSLISQANAWFLYDLKFIHDLN